jgi:hypothetical protein
MEYLRTLFLSFLIFSFVYLFIFSFTTYSSVVLNEVAIQPNQTVELYNTASTSADISSWYIDDAGGMTYFTIPIQTILSPQSCLIFSADFNFNKSSSDTVRLFDSTSPPTSSSAQLIEHYSYTKAPDSNFSLSKNRDGGTEWQITNSSVGLSNESFLSCVPIPTPTLSPTETPTPTSTITPSPTFEPTQSPSPTLIVEYNNIFISEIYPYPQSNEHEWIELYNDNDTQVNLDHWYIDDGENTGSTPKSFSMIIGPYSYAIIDLTSALFNNGGDVVRILDNGKNEKDSMEYGKISQGKSMARISFTEDNFCEQEVTKNTLNIACVPEQKEHSSPINKTSPVLVQKISPTAKMNQNITLRITGTQVNESIKRNQQEGEILGIQINGTKSKSPVPFLSSVSGLYSLLTIVSIFIRMKNA